MLLRTLVVIGLGFLSLLLNSSFSKADIIGPQSPTKELTLPEAMLSEVAPEIVASLNPLMVQFSNNDFKGFKEAFATVASTTDTLPAAEVFWAKLLVVSNRFPEATRVLEEYLRKQPTDPEAFVTLGILAAKSGRFTDGWLQLTYAQRLIEREGLSKARQELVMPNFIDARCVVAENRHQWAEAQQMFQKLQLLKPNDQSIIWRTGRSQVLAGNISDGHALMQKACAKDDKLPKASLAVAQTLADTKDWSKDLAAAKEIATWFDKAIAENPADDKAHAAYFKWLLLDNRPATVLEKSEKLADEIKSVREIVILRSLAARYLGDLVTAEKMLLPLHEANPDDLETADQLALVLVESADEAKRAKALQLSERNLRAAPNVETTLATAAWIQLQLGSKEIADRLLSQLAARGATSPQTTYYISELLNSVGRVAESLKLRKAAVDAVGIFPQREQAKKSLGN